MDRVNSILNKIYDENLLSEEKTVSENIKLVHLCVRKLIREGYEYEDLFQIGCIGLVKSVRRFDQKRGIKFSTYAVPAIMGEIKRFIRDDGLIKVSRTLKEIRLKMNNASKILSQKLMREPSLSEISFFLGIDTEKLILASEYDDKYISLQTPILCDDSLTLEDTIEDKNFSYDNIDIIDMKTAVCKLQPRERKIIVLRYFKSKTQSETSKIIGVSQVQISRIEKKALKKLNDYLKE